MLISLAALALGFIMLAWSADNFAEYALSLGKLLHISSFIIGFVVLGFGTSAPELLVSGFAAWQGNPGLAIGNALGSNTTNILLILGVTLCLIPLQLKKDVLRSNFFLLLVATVIFSILLLDKLLNRFDGIILISALFLSLFVLTRLNISNVEKTNSENTSNGYNLIKLTIGLLFTLVILLLSSKLVVWAAVAIAEKFGVSDLVIGLTIIALGTSLPELATCVASALKKNSELVLGNIIGSNIFNTLGVTGTASIIAAYSVPQQVITRDLPIMLGATAALFLLAWIFASRNKIPRAFGAPFILAYALYMFYIFQQSI